MAGILRIDWKLLVMAALALLLAALLGLQTLRIEGFRAGHITVLGMDRWLIDLGGFRPALARCTAQNIEFISAQAEAEALQAAVNEDEEARTAANAKRSDQNHDNDLARTLAAGRAYADQHRIAADGVRPESDRGAPGQAIAPAQSDGTGLPADLPANRFVAISDPDLQACTRATTYAVGAHNWAATLPPEASKIPATDQEH